MQVSLAPLATPADEPHDCRSSRSEPRELQPADEPHDCFDLMAHLCTVAFCART
jgi:hypothetical protein